MVQPLLALAPTLLVIAFFLLGPSNWSRHQSWARAITCLVVGAVALRYMTWRLTETVLPYPGDGVNVYTAIDNRPRFLSDIGMKLAPVVTENTKTNKDFFIPWSAEKANELDSDIFVTWVPDATTAEAIKTDPLLGQIPAIKGGALVADSDNTLTLSISASSPLSLPWALDTFLPQLGKAADAAGK